jgi:hypothetical protein
VRCSTDGLHTSVFASVVVARGNDMAVKCAANLLAIFHDGGLSAYLHTSVFDHFNAVNNLNFFQHDDFLSYQRIHSGLGLTIDCPRELGKSFQVPIGLFDWIVSIQVISATVGIIREVGLDAIN